MFEMCSSVLKSEASLARHMKVRIDMCSDCGVTSKTKKEHNNHKRKHQTFDCNKCLLKIFLTISLQCVI